MRQLLVEMEDGGDRVRLGPEEQRRLRKVLRLGDGARVDVLDSLGARRGVGVLQGEELLVEGWEPLGPDPHPDLLLVTGPIKGDRLEWAAQRCFEAGLRGLRLVRTERAQLAPPPRLLRRLESLARAVCEQSGRVHLPVVDGAEGLEPALEACAAEGREVILLHPGGDPFPAELSGAKALLVGPEGGFTEAEVAGARAAGVRVVGLGGHVLRAETAMVVGVTLALDRLGWLAPKSGR